MSSIEVWWNR